MAFTNHHWNADFPDYDAENVNDGTETTQVDVPHYLIGHFPDYGIEDIVDPA